MSVIFILIPLSILIAACFLAAFIWAVRSGQYEDTTTPSMRLLLDDVGPPRATTRSAEHRSAAEAQSTHHAEQCSALRPKAPALGETTSPT